MFFYNTQSQGSPTHTICFDPIQFLTRLQWAWAECRRTWDRCDRTSRRLGPSFSAPAGSSKHTQIWASCTPLAGEAQCQVAFRSLGPTHCAQWMTMTPCDPCANVSVGLPVLKDVLEQPLSVRLTDSLSSWYCISIVFPSFSFLVSCPSFLLMTLSMSHSMCIVSLSSAQRCLTLLDYELCSLDMLSTLLMTFDMSVVVSRFVTAPAVVSVEQSRVFLCL